MPNDYYTNPLSLTSQFLFCGLPLRLDSYRGCAFQCSFCYARFRGGHSASDTVTPADPETLQRRLATAFRGNRNPQPLIAQLLRRRVPIHFGGMSDPFQNAERRYGVTRRFLESLSEYNYPTVISTRSAAISHSPYLELLQSIGPVVVQFSLVSTEASVARRFEPHSSTPQQLLRAMARLSRAGIDVTCRWQPYIPTVSESPWILARRVTDAGAKHIALEHLKLPLERGHRLWPKLAAATDFDLRDYFLSRGAIRDGREYILPAAEKLPTVLEARAAIHGYGATFGAADNEFQYLSDSGCCCSGVDRFPGFENWFKHQIAHAVRKCRGRRIVYGAVSREWLPSSSVDRWLNSKTRIGRRFGNRGTTRDHIRLRWNSPEMPFSPASYFGVEPSDEYSSSGYRIYRWNTTKIETL